MRNCWGGGSRQGCPAWRRHHPARADEAVALAGWVRDQLSQRHAEGGAALKRRSNLYTLPIHVVSLVGPTCCRLLNHVRSETVQTTPLVFRAETTHQTSDWPVTLCPVDRCFTSGSSRLTWCWPRSTASPSPTSKPGGSALGECATALFLSLRFHGASALFSLSNSTVLRVPIAYLSLKDRPFADRIAIAAVLGRCPRTKGRCTCWSPSVRPPSTPRPRPSRTAR